MTNVKSIVIVILLFVMQMTLQSFIDKLFESIFAADSNLPPAVKYLFDLFDDAAHQHGLTDPDVVHSWKSNRSFFYLLAKKSPSAVALIAQAL